MRKFVSVVLAVSALGMAGAAGAAFAEDKPVKADAPKTEVKKTDQDRIVCHPQDQTGSRLGQTKICHTVAEWASIAKEAQAATMETQMRSKQTGTPGG